MQVENLDRCVYKIQLSEREQEVVESLQFWYEVPQEKAFEYLMNHALMQVGVSALLQFKENG